jgi:hypothetical protein
MPIEVEAHQWFPPGDIRHVPVEGVVHHPPLVRYSADGKLYYVTGSDQLTTQWLSVEKVPIEEAEKFKGNGFDGMAGFNHNGHRYGRKVYPFATYEIKSGKEEPVDRESDLYLDYGSAEGWKGHPAGTSYIDTLEGRMSVKPGDWVITGVKGERYPCKPDIFEATYEPA